MKCQHCGSKENLFVNSTRKNKRGEDKHSYMCRDCNTKRKKAYFATKRGRERLYEAVYKSIKKYPERQKARGKLNYAVQSGSIVKPEICQNCLESKRVEAHHDDYSKPLDVMWLCRSCHIEQHKS